jgi:hypothetical protein
MRFGEPSIHNGDAAYFHQDVEELNGTLGNLKAWVEAMIAKHGADAEIEIRSDDDDAGVEYSLRRKATAEELSRYEQRQEQWRDAERMRREQQYLELKAEFEGK